MKAEQDNQACYQAYLAHRVMLNENELASGRSLDKHLLGYASGALVLSVTFIHEVATKPVMASRCWLLVSWCCLCATIALTIVSFGLSRLAFRRQADIWDAFWKDYLHHGEQATLGKNRRTTATDTITCIAIVLFIVGLISSLAFACWNLPK